MALLRNTPTTNKPNPFLETIDAPVTFTEPPPLYSRVAERAYYKAEARGFESGYEVEDWLSAEKELRDKP